MQKLFDVGGRQQNVFVDGVGPALLLVHGFPLDHTMWRHQLEYFSKSMRVIAPDLRGFGKSDVDFARSISMQDYADDLAELIKRLELDGPTTFCGLSMGGYIGWQLLKFHGQLFDRAIFSNTKASADDEKTARGRRLVAGQVVKHGINEIANQMPLKLLGSAAPDGLESELRSVISSTDSRSIAAAQRGMSERPDMSWFLSSIDKPTLFIGSSEDEITPPSEMREMSDVIPNSTFHLIEGAGHMSPLEEPGEFNEVVEKFLTS